MSIKINFAPEGTSVSNEYTVDFGQEYNFAQGFGWVTQASLNDANPTPINIVANTRDRNSESDDRLDTFIHLQYPIELTDSTGSNSTPSAWEYNLADGLYQVTVSVGDSNFTDSNHVINLEGQSVISGFTPTENERFRVTTSLVEVTDGKLTLDANGGNNTKLNFVEITPADAIRVNFGVANNITPTGYIQDIGNAYDDSRGFGWITQDSVGSNQATPVSAVANTRDRNTSVLDTLDSLIHLQYPDSLNNPNSLSNPVAWEYELANGQYQVTVSVGDASFTDSNHVINIEGQSVISGFTPSSNQLFQSATKVIEVTDGKLTVDAIGGENSKINFIEVVPFTFADHNVTLDNNPALPANSININFGIAVISAPAGFIQDIGQGFSTDRGYGWITQDSVGSGQSQSIDIVPNGRLRNASFVDDSGSLISNPLLDSLIHLQYPTGTAVYNDSITTAAAWEYQLENGQYEVTVSVGDASFTDSNHVINIEGQNVISGFSPSGLPVDPSLPATPERFTTGTATVEVTDGRLTIDAIGGDNTKINYVSILPVDSEIG